MNRLLSVEAVYDGEKINMPAIPSINPTLRATVCERLQKIEIIFSSHFTVLFTGSEMGVDSGCERFGGARRE